MKKFALMLLMVATIVSFGFAQVSGLTLGTAETVRDTVSYAMDVLDWNKAEYGNFFGFTSIDSATSLNFLGGQHYKGGNLAYSYTGNLWKEGEDNYSVFYGKKNMGFLFSLDADKADTGRIDGTQVEDYGVFSPSFTFGMNATDKISFKAGFGLNTTAGEVETTLMGNEYLSKVSLTLPIIQLDGYYTFKSTNKLFIRAGLSYVGLFLNSKTKSYVNGELDETVKSSQTVNSLGLVGLLEYKPTDRFTYGLKAVFPDIMFTGGKDTNGDALDSSTTIEFVLCNGFVAEVSPDRFLLSFGMITELPSFIFVEDQDTEYGIIYNSYYLGMGFYLTPQIRIDGTASISPTSGISMETIWTQKLKLSVFINM